METGLVKANEKELKTPAPLKKKPLKSETFPANPFKSTRIAPCGPGVAG